MIGRLLAAGLLTGVVLLAGAAPASAHNTLVSADPAEGSHVASGPQEVRLTFDQPVQKGFSTVTVTGPGDTRWEAAEPAVSGNVVTAAVRPLGPAGDYVVGYRIVSADGHPVSGTVRFTLTTEGTGTPAQPKPGVEAGDTGGGGMPVWPWIVGAVLLLGVGVLVGLRLSRSPG